MSMKTLKPYGLLALWLLLAAGTAVAQEPQPVAYVPPRAVVTPSEEGADKEFELGDIGELSYVGSEFEGTPKWDITSAPKGAKIRGDGSVSFPTKASGRYRIVLAVAKVNPTTKFPEVDVVVWEFSIRGADPLPPAPVDNSLAARVAAAFEGPDAQADAELLAAVLEQFADALPMAGMKRLEEVPAGLADVMRRTGLKLGKHKKLVPLVAESFSGLSMDTELTPELTAKVQSIYREIARGAAMVK